MKISDIGLKEVYCVEPTANLVDVAGLMKDHAISTVPVCEEGRLIGLVTQRDITVGCTSVGLNAWTCQARDFMMSPAITVRPEQSVEEAVQIMNEKKLRKLPVVDELNRPVGMVTLNDIAMAYIERNELIVETMRNTTTQTSHIAV